MYVTNHLVSMENNVLAQFCSNMSSEVVLTLIRELNDAFLCPVNTDPEIIQLACVRKGKFMSQQGHVIGKLEENVLLKVEDRQDFATTTVRHVCSVCPAYCNTLRAMVSRAKHFSGQVGLHTNIRYLRTPQRSAYIKSLQRAIKTKTRQVQRMRSKLNDLMVSSNCIEIDNDLNSDISNVM